MNKELEGNWKELKGKMRQTWSKLTDDDLGRLQGNWEELSGRLQSLYGHSKEKAWSEIEAFKGRFLSKAERSVEE